MTVPYQGPLQPHAPLKVVEPDTLEHALWVHQQDLKRAAAEQKFAETSHHRPAHRGTTVAKDPDHA